MINFKDFLIIGYEERIDRSLWVEGEWNEEPDFAKWKYKGRNCYIIRRLPGYFCAYVAAEEARGIEGDFKSNYFSDFLEEITWYGARKFLRLNNFSKEEHSEYMIGIDFAHSQHYSDLSSICSYKGSYINFSEAKRLSHEMADILDKMEKTE